jgi:hypothetical protein
MSAERNLDRSSLDTKKRPLLSAPNQDMKRQQGLSFQSHIHECPLRAKTDITQLWTAKTDQARGTLRFFSLEPNA